ncbi:hypothetical protein HY498_01090 [Candidatus Woesearchaeota archaeon]|nr:hypothetical protein [Candidatus Woesearchaeota archaeon]
MKFKGILNKKIIFIFIALIVFFSIYLFAQKPNLENKTQIPLITDQIELKFIKLSTEGSASCFGPGTVLEMQDQERIQGSCCGPMVLHRYEEQIEGLKKYSNIPQIPKDPYDIEIKLAKELLDYQKNIKLTDNQQKIYNEAMGMSQEGGPCCCKCWRWYVYEGLAKYLIVNHNFTAKQIAELWDMSDGCGGESHAPGLAHGMT